MFQHIFVKLNSGYEKLKLNSGYEKLRGRLQAKKLPVFSLSLSCSCSISIKASSIYTMKVTSEMWKYTGINGAMSTSSSADEDQGPVVLGAERRHGESQYLHQRTSLNRHDQQSKGQGKSSQGSRPRPHNRSVAKPEIQPKSVHS